MSDDDALVRMEVKGLMLDPSSNVPIVILREEGGQHILPIWIGVFEANAIALKLEGVEPPRPMTHDLMASLLFDLHAKVEQVIVSDLSESTFYAQVVLTSNGQRSTIDARPSDAIALALRVEAPILVAREVFDKAKAADLADKVSDEEKLKKWLEDVDPEELGKYKM